MPQNRHFQSSAPLDALMQRRSDPLQRGWVGECSLDVV